MKKSGETDFLRGMRKVGCGMWLQKPGSAEYQLGTAKNQLSRALRARTIAKNL